MTFLAGNDTAFPVAPLLMIRNWALRQALPTRGNHNASLLVRQTLRYICRRKTTGPTFSGELMARSKSSKDTMSTEGKQPDAPKPAPGVIVDFVFDDGLFFISVRNIGAQPAYKVSTKFDHKILGLGGAREVSALPLFRNIEFLAPGREIRAFLDSSDSYFARKQPTKITAEVLYRDYYGDKHKVSIFHDLEIYRELPFISKAEPGPIITDEAIDEGEQSYGTV